MITGGGIAALALAVVAFLLSPRVGEPADPARVATRPYVTLFVVSFVALFAEVMLIRYVGSQVRVFSFYKNVPLVSCFLGLGLGCFQGQGRARHAFLFLLWLVPFAILLSPGSLVIDACVSPLAARASSEHVLGTIVPQAARPGEILRSQLLMGLFAAGTLVAMTLLFSLLGRLLADAFERTGRLAAYTCNIAGSLAGILAFVALSTLETPPFVWLLAGLLPLLLWAATPTAAFAAVLLAGLCAAAVFPSLGDTVWSRYQKLVGYEVPAGGGRSAYLIRISDVFYQVAMDLTPDGVAAMGKNPMPHYDAVYEILPRGAESVLIVGAGSGNDVAAALRAGVKRVDAVDIDPAIVRMGRLHHPEHPYDDARVRVIVDDARAAFRRLPAGSYDAVIFGLLDSHTQLGVSSVRLDNYVFTQESFAAARRLVRPGGYLVVTAATLRSWFRDRFVELVRSAAGNVTVRASGTWITYAGKVGGEPDPRPTSSAILLPTDDWPFLYLPDRTIPRAYLLALGMLVAASLGVLRAAGIPLSKLSALELHFFFLGAAFLLMEVTAINRLALLFGTTWLVSAVTISVVLVLIIGANAVLATGVSIGHGACYALLVASLAGSYVISPGVLVGKGGALAYACSLLLVSPVFFAGLVFARSFQGCGSASRALGANILGSVLGGWLEYLTMAVGIRALLLVALALYLLSLLALLRRRPYERTREGLATAPQIATST